MYIYGYMYTQIICKNVQQVGSCLSEDIVEMSGATTRIVVKQLSSHVKNELLSKQTMERMSP